MFFFSNRFGVDSVRFPLKDDLIMKVWEYGMIDCILKFPNPEYPFFSHLTRFQKCMFTRTDQVFTSPNIPMRAPYNTNWHIHVHYALIEYEHRKVKSDNYPV